MPSTIPFETMTTGDQARLVRVSNHWTQGQVACLAKVSQVDVSRLERNLHVKEGVKQKILRVLGLLD